MEAVSLLDWQPWKHWKPWQTPTPSPTPMPIKKTPAPTPAPTPAVSSQVPGMAPVWMPGNASSSIRLICCCLSLLACIWALCHLCCKSARLRVKVFWVQLVALVFADLLLSLEIAKLSMTSSPILWSGELTGTLIWSFLLEVQISLGVAGACVGLTCCAPVLRSMIFASLPVAFAFAYVDSWFLEARPKEDHAWLWCAVFIICLLMNIGAYTYAHSVASNSPLIVRRRIMLRGFSYACNFLITVLPNLTLDFFVATGAAEFDRTVPQADDVALHGWALLHFICGCLYCLSGVFNIGTYVLWLLWDEYVEARIVFRAGIADLEQTLQLNGYFNLDEAAALEADRNVANAISQAQSARQGNVAPGEIEATSKMSKQ